MFARTLGNHRGWLLRRDSDVASYPNVTNNSAGYPGDESPLCKASAGAQEIGVTAAWFAANRALPVGDEDVYVTIGADRESEVTILSIDLHVETEPLNPADYMAPVTPCSTPTGGADPVDTVLVNLVAPNTPLRVFLPGPSKEVDLADYVISVAAGHAYTFRLRASLVVSQAPACVVYRWTATLNAIVRGTRRSITVDDRGQPFSVTRVKDTQLADQIQNPTAASLQRTSASSASPTCA